jgi:hypothetical protein
MVQYFWLTKTPYFFFQKCHQQLQIFTPKKLTGEQIKYIINHALVPKLEYRYQKPPSPKKNAHNHHKSI